MKSELGSAHWVMPWLAPFALGSLYFAELWREGAFTEPVGGVTQTAVAVPLVVAASVFLTVVEQELRAREH